MCKAAGTFGAEPVVTPEWVEFILPGEFAEHGHRAIQTALCRPFKAKKVPESHGTIRH